MPAPAPDRQASVQAAGTSPATGDAGDKSASRIAVIAQIALGAAPLVPYPLAVVFGLFSFPYRLDMVKDIETGLALVFFWAMVCYPLLYFLCLAGFVLRRRRGHAGAHRLLRPPLLLLAGLIGLILVLFAIQEARRSREHRHVPVASPQPASPSPDRRVSFGTHAGQSDDEQAGRQHRHPDRRAQAEQRHASQRAADAQPIGPA